MNHSERKTTLFKSHMVQNTGGRNRGQGEGSSRLLLLSKNMNNVPKCALPVEKKNVVPHKLSNMGENEVKCPPTVYA